MNIFDTPLGSDVSKVIELNGRASTACHLRMEWTIPGKDIFAVEKIHSVNTLRDYREASMDLMTAIIEVSVEDYQKTIYPNRALLEMSIYRTEASMMGDAKGNTPKKRAYKVMLLTNDDPELFDQTYSGNNTKEKVNNRMNISIQLIEWELYKYKDVEYGTVLGPGVIEDYLYFFMSHQGNMKCSVHPPDNTADVDNTIIPEGIELIGLANWIQRESVGIYDHGINTYYQDGVMYVYPVALLTPHEYRRSISIFRAGSDMGIGTGNTYATIDGKLNIISSGEVPNDGSEPRMIDEREQLEQTYGNAVRWNDPRYQSSVIDQTNDTMRYTSRGSKVFGLSDVDIKIQRVHKQHTANPHAQRSIINKTLGRVITIPWQSGDASLIEPGTEVTYYYMKGRGMEYVTGIVDGTIEVLTLQSDNKLKGMLGIETILRLRVN